ncbi:unnamed protein product [Pleuronectes platessa]|uniref:Uncharacterized protein n=1 Tax=Pleuronectes platessa TaxID=8262 RepID=A0A9N7VGH5_PLEPL|nr:unnamed protein product [Pleuronectes platessa]
MKKKEKRLLGAASREDYQACRLNFSFIVTPAEVGSAALSDGEWEYNLPAWQTISAPAREKILGLQRRCAAPAADISHSITIILGPVLSPTCPTTCPDGLNGWTAGPPWHSPHLAAVKRSTSQTMQESAPPLARSHNKPPRSWPVRILIMLSYIAPPRKLTEKQITLSHLTSCTSGHTGLSPTWMPAKRIQSGASLGGTGLESIRH